MRSTASEPQINLDSQICRQCGGLCCQAHPGAWAEPARLAALFMGGAEFCLEDLESRTEALKLQLRNYSGVPVPAPQTNEDGCLFLGPGGCELRTDERPCQCLGLTPEIDTLTTGDIHCRMPGNLSYGAIRDNWLHYWASRTDRPAPSP